MFHVGDYSTRELRKRDQKISERERDLLIREAAVQQREKSIVARESALALATSALRREEAQIALLRSELAREATDHDRENLHPLSDTAVLARVASRPSLVPRRPLEDRRERSVRKDVLLIWWIGTKHIRICTVAYQ